MQQLSLLIPKLFPTIYQFYRIPQKRPSALCLKVFCFFAVIF